MTLGRRAARRRALIALAGGWLAHCAGNGSGSDDGGIAASAPTDALVFGKLDTLAGVDAGKPAAKDGAGDAGESSSSLDAQTGETLGKNDAKAGKDALGSADGQADEGPSSDLQTGEDTAPAPVCGDGICGEGENWANCDPDCPAPPAKCGDSLCTPTENQAQCPVDCDKDVIGVMACLAGKCKALLQACLAQPLCVDTLGNGAQCLANCTDEDCWNFCIDSQAMVPAAKALAACGFKACANAQDGTVCGDGTCDAGESAASCPVDCGGGDPGKPVCADGNCTGGETAKTCPMDCDPKGKAAWQCGEQKCPTETADCKKDPACIPVLLQAGDCIDKCGGGDKCAQQCAGPVLGNAAALALAQCGLANCQ